MRVLDPLADINKPAERKPLKGIETMHGKRVGLLWGRHAASVKFWPVLEEVVLKKFLRVSRCGSTRTAAGIPRPTKDIEDFAGKVDYAFVGVGA